MNGESGARGVGEEIQWSRVICPRIIGPGGSYLRSRRPDPMGIDVSPGCWKGDS